MSTISTVSNFNKTKENEQRKERHFKNEKGRKEMHFYSLAQ